MAQLSSLTIRGYKSIKELKEFSLNSLNVLVGANGAGKSNFIGLLKLLNEIYNQNLQVYLQKQGGPDALLHFGRKITKSISVEFKFGYNFYSFELVPTSDNRLIFEKESTAYSHPYYGGYHERLVGRGQSEAKVDNTNDSYADFIKPSLQGWRVYHFHDTSESAAVKQKHSVNDNLRLKTDAANLAAYLRMLRLKYPMSYQHIVDTIRLVVPYFKDFVYRENEHDSIELEWFHQADFDTPFRAHTLSDGSLRFICLTTLLLQPTELQPDTILIDEPELGLHPYAITLLADMFKQVTEAGRRQLIVATQSVELLNELTPEDIVVVEQENASSSFKRFSKAELSGWLEEYNMGELWKRNVLGGRP